MTNLRLLSHAIFKVRILCHRKYALVGRTIFSFDILYYCDTGGLFSPNNAQESSRCRFNAESKNSSFA